MGPCVGSCARFLSDEKVVETKLETAMKRLAEPDALQRGEPVGGRAPRLVLVNLGFLGDDADREEDVQQGINHPGGPGNDERSTGGQHAVGFAKDPVWVLEVLQYCKHRDVIERGISERQGGGDVRSHQGTVRYPGSDGLVVYPHAPDGSVSNGVEKESIDTTPKITEATA